ncbi:MAG: hypothetical protein ABJO06_02600 [Roseibium sp.]|uniref:hypothetical protein n=1 Tax=Roseibium sp. TaxID=1936156 RepID=UPI00329707DD
MALASEAFKAREGNGEIHLNSKCFWHPGRRIRGCEKKEAYYDIASEQLSKAA